MGTITTKIGSVQFIEQLLQMSLQYECKHIQYEVNEERVSVWSVSENGNPYGDAFYATDLLIAFNMFTTYMRYNNDKKRVELVILEK
jgi:hypothetical protein